MQRHLVPFLLAVLLALPGIASAQFVPPDEAKPQPQEEAYTPPPAPPRAHPARPADNPDVGPARPEPFSLGIGAGWAFPQSIIEPNVGSARFLLSVPVTLEANAAFDFGTGTDRTDQPGDDIENKTGLYNIGAGIDVRFAFLRKGPANMVFIGSAAFNVLGEQVDPQGPENVTRTTTSTFGLGYGLGIDWYITKHLGLSADARNPLVTFTSTVDEAPSADITHTVSTVQGGFFWQPTVRIMFHVWF